MKKVLFMLMFFAGIATTLTSCKKDDEKTEKEKTLELLTSGKWYYQSYKITGSTNTNTCFNASSYWEFKADGTFNETWDFGSGPYAISEDGKTINATSGKNSYAITITAISNSNFSFTLSNGKVSQEFVLAKTALTCSTKK